MKKILRVVGVALCLVAFTQDSNAQFSVGVDLSMPMGSFADSYGIGLGGSVGYDHEINDNMKVGGQLGLLRFGGKEDDFEKSMKETYDDYESSSSVMLIPILGNFKYYFTDNTNGFYGIGSLGMSMYKSKSEVSYTYDAMTGYNYTTGEYTYEKETVSSDSDFSGTYLTFGFGAGYLINEKIDLGLRYTIVSASGGSLSHLNLRAAFNF